MMGVQSTVTVWKPGEEPKPAPARQGSTGRPRKLLQRDCEAPTSLSQRTGPVVAGRGLEEGDLAPGSEEETAVALCRFAGASSASRLLASGTASGRMAADRMAGRRNRTHQVLAVHPASRYPFDRTGAHGQTSLDHRAGLPGTETGTRIWVTTKDAAGEVFIITPPYASRPMDSWWPNGIVFPPQPVSAILDYQRPNSPPDFRPRGSPRSSRAA